MNNSEKQNQNINKNQENNSEQVKLEAREYAHDAMHCLVYHNFEAAVELFSKAIELNPEATDSYYYRGEAYRMLQQIDLAKKDFQKAVEKMKPDNPNYIQALKKLG